MRVWDATGKEHLDAVSGGVWTVNVGYGRERIADAVRDQLVKMNYFANSARARSPARSLPKTDRERCPA
jgi:taurine-pyruvate aminotransferase